VTKIHKFHSLNTFSQQRAKKSQNPNGLDAEFVLGMLRLHRDNSFWARTTQIEDYA